jgi:hypothetical protein
VQVQLQDEARPSQPKLKANQTAVLLAGLVTIIGMAVPYLRWLLMPIQYLNTHAHEFFHAITAVATGGHAQKILVFADGSGVTPVAVAPHNVVLVGSAGYVGAAAMGAGMMAWSRSERGARRTLGVLSLLLLFSLFVWVRGDVVGIISGIGWVFVLGAGALWLRGLAAIFAAQFFGLQQCLNAIQSLYVLIYASVYPEHMSDAHHLARHTGIPAYVWAFLWIMISAVFIAIALRTAWLPKRRP